MDISLFPRSLFFPLTVGPPRSDVGQLDCAHSDDSLLSRESRVRSLCPSTHLYHCSPEHTDGDDLFFTKAVFATICYGFSFIPSSVFGSFPHSYDLYRLDKTTDSLSFRSQCQTPRVKRKSCIIYYKISGQFRKITWHFSTFVDFFSHSRFLELSPPDKTTAHLLFSWYLCQCHFFLIVSSGWLSYYTTTELWHDRFWQDNRGLLVWPRGQHTFFFFSCKEPDYKYFWFCGQYSLCWNYFTLLSQCESSHRWIHKWMAMAGSQ